MRRSSKVLVLLAVIGGFVACDNRLDPRYGGIGRQPITAPTGDYELRAVDGQPLPHVATNSGTNYALTSGSFSLRADSTWLFTTMEAVSSTGGAFIGNSPANYQGSWTVTDTTINLRTGYGTARVKGDTIFWRGGPRHTWEDTLEFTLVRK